MSIIAMTIVKSLANDVRNAALNAVVNTPERKAIVKNKLGYWSIDEFMRAKPEIIENR